MAKVIVKIESITLQPLIDGLSETLARCIRLAIEVYHDTVTKTLHFVYNPDICPYEDSTVHFMAFSQIKNSSISFLQEEFSGISFELNAKTTVQQKRSDPPSQHLMEIVFHSSSVGKEQIISFDSGGNVQRLGRLFRRGAVRSEKIQDDPIVSSKKALTELHLEIQEPRHHTYAYNKKHQKQLKVKRHNENFEREQAELAASKNKSLTALRQHIIRNRLHEPR